MKRVTILIIVTLSIISIISINLSCTKHKTPAGTITYLSGKVTVNDTSPSLGQSVNVSDTIITGDSSLTVVQFDENALMVIRSNSKIELLSADNNQGTLYVEIDQLYGNTFHKVIKGTTKYIVNTATLKATVNGRLDIITLKSGKKLKGMILERGMMFKIETPDGIQYIEKSQIESQTITQ